MEGRSFLRRKDREAVRERWLLHAGKAFERMFAEANQEQLVTFTEREDMACLLGQELAVFLLQEHAAADGQVRHAEQRPPCCRKCQQPAERVTKKSELRAALKRMLDSTEPYLLDVIVPYTEHVLPMIPAGKTVRDIIIDADTKVELGDNKGL